MLLHNFVQAVQSRKPQSLGCVLRDATCSLTTVFPCFVVGETGLVYLTSAEKSAQPAIAFLHRSLLLRPVPPLTSRRRVYYIQTLRRVTTHMQHLLR